jgi:hypothetical protein
MLEPPAAERRASHIRQRLITWGPPAAPTRPVWSSQKRAGRPTRKGHWYGFKKGLRGRFGRYVPPVMEALGLAEVEHNARNNRMRAI